MSGEDLAKGWWLQRTLQFDDQLCLLESQTWMMGGLVRYHR